MLNDIGLSVWKSKYATNGTETYEQGCKRVADYLEVPQVEQLMLEQKFIPGGRVLYGAGKSKAHMVNCVLLKAIDSAEGWATLLRDSTLALTKGAGIGVSYDEIRPYGSLIKGSGGTASGSVSLMKMVNEVARHIMQGNSLRAAVFGSLHWQHGDIDEFLNVKNWNEDYQELKSKNTNYPAPLDFTNISVRLDNEFIEEYHRGNGKAVKVWDILTTNMFSMSEPGIQFDNDGQILRNA